MKNNFARKGFTLVEMLIGFSILVAIVLITGLFIQNILNFTPFLQSALQSQSEITQTLQAAQTELRSVNISNAGSYPIDAAASNTLTFYSDIDEDGLAEKVRYFLSGTTFKKGVIKPSGNPLGYSSQNEITNNVVSNVIPPTGSSTIFSYYDYNYSGSEAPMSFPILVTNVKTIGITITSKQENSGPNTTYNIFATPRNLRSNL